jgi:hypothetical protein
MEERRPKCLKPSSSGACKLRAKEVERQLRKLQKEGGKSSEKCSRGAEKCSRHASTSSSKETAHGKSAEKLKLKGSSSPPAWFEKYMQKVGNIEIYLLFRYFFQSFSVLYIKYQNSQYNKFLLLFYCIWLYFYS